MDIDIPETRRTAVASAIKALFGQAMPEITPVLGGGSAAVRKLTAGGSTMLLRVERRQDAMADPRRTYACMRLAAEAGLAPRVLWADEDAGVAVTEFIEARPLTDYPGGRQALLGELGARLRDLQGLSFPTFVPFVESLGELLTEVRSQQVLDDGTCAEVIDAYAQLRRSYGAPLRLGGSHNDPNPGNILFDGRRLWLIDWETAFASDPHLDPALSSLWLCRTMEDDADLMGAWLGRAPRSEDVDRHQAMKQFGRLYYACLMLLTALATGRSHAGARLRLADEASVFDLIDRGERPASGAGQIAFAQAFLCGFVRAAKGKLQALHL